MALLGNTSESHLAYCPPFKKKKKKGKKRKKKYKIFPKELQSKAKHPITPITKIESPKGEGREERGRGGLGATSPAPPRKVRQRMHTPASEEMGETECHRNRGVLNGLGFKTVLNKIFTYKKQTYRYLLSTVCICLHVTGEAASSGPQTPLTPLHIYRINDNKYRARTPRGKSQGNKTVTSLWDPPATATTAGKKVYRGPIAKYWVCLRLFKYSRRALQEAKMQNQIFTV